jgi:hypothetical protein
VTTGEAGAKKCTRGFDSGDRDNAREKSVTLNPPVYQFSMDLTGYRNTDPIATNMRSVVQSRVQATAEAARNQYCRKHWHSESPHANQPSLSHCTGEPTKDSAPETDILEPLDVV